MGAHECLSHSKWEIERYIVFSKCGRKVLCGNWLNQNGAAQRPRGKATASRCTIRYTYREGSRTVFKGL